MILGIIPTNIFAQENVKYATDPTTAKDNEYVYIENQKLKEDFLKILKDRNYRYVVGLSGRQEAQVLLTDMNYVKPSNENEITVKEAKLFKAYPNQKGGGLGSAIPGDTFNIVSLKGLEYFANLEVLAINNGKVKDLTPLKNLKKLRMLSLTTYKEVPTELENLSPLKDLTNLSDLELGKMFASWGKSDNENLKIKRNNIKDISYLSNLTNLKILCIDGGYIKDLSPLKNLRNLTALAAQSNEISDISILTKLPSLVGAELYNNKISDLSKLTGAIGLNLKTLGLSDNFISDITPLANTNFDNLDLSNQHVEIKANSKTIKNPLKTPDNSKITYQKDDTKYLINGNTITIKDTSKEKIIIPFDSHQMGKSTTFLSDYSGHITAQVSKEYSEKRNFKGEISILLSKAVMFKPTIVEEKVTIGSPIDLTDNISNLPEGASVKDISNPKIDINKIQETSGKVKVTFKDGSSAEYEIPVKIENIVCEETKPLKDRIRELEGQIGELQGQKTKLEENVNRLTQEVATANSDKEKITNELNESKTKLEAANNKITELERKIKTLEEEIKTLKEENEQLKKDKVALEEEIKTLKEQLATCKESNEKLQEKISNLEKEIETLKEANAEKDNKIKDLEKQIAEKEKNLENIKKELENADELIKKLRAEKAKLVDEINDKKSELEQAKQDLENLKQELEAEKTKAKEEKENLQKQVDEVNKNLEDLNKKLKGIQEEKHNLQENLDAEKAKTDKNEEKIKDLENKIVDKNKQEEELTKEKETLTQKTKDLGDKIVEKDKEIEKLNLTITEKENNIKGLETKISNLENEKKDLEEKIKNLLDKDNSKDELLAKLNKEIENLKAELEKINKESKNKDKTIEDIKRENDLKEAKRLVEEAEKTKTKEAKDKAQNAINKLADSAEKNALQERLNKVELEETDPNKDLRTQIEKLIKKAEREIEKNKDISRTQQRKIEDVIDEAKETLINKKADRNDLKEVKRKLEDALDSLLVADNIFTRVNKSKLEIAIKDAESIDKKSLNIYEEDDLNRAINEAKKVYYDYKSTQTEVDKQADNLKKLVDKYKKYKKNESKLSKIINEAGSENLQNYLDKIRIKSSKDLLESKRVSDDRNYTSLKYVFKINAYKYAEATNKEINIYKIDVKPVVRNDRTMMPLRYVGYVLGADVAYDNYTRTASFTRNGITAKIQIDGNQIVTSDGKSYTMDSKPLNINNRILVSLTNISRVFNITNGDTDDGIDQDIEWNQNDKTVTINIVR